MKQTITKLMLLTLTLLMAVGINAAKKVHTLGDSTMAPYDPDVTNTRGWGMYFGNFLTNGWTSVNYAKGGRDSRMGYTELWQNAKNNVEEGDYVLIQFAHNDTQYGGMDNLQLQEYYTKIGDATNAAAVKKDGRGTIPSSTYKQCLKQIVDAVKEKKAIPVLVSAVCRCYFTNGVAPITRAGRHDMGDKYQILTENGPVSGPKLDADDHSYDFTYQMAQLAKDENVAFIDMTAATKALYESYGTYDKCYAALFEKGGEADNTHYNTTGALTAARLCAQLMKDQGMLTDAIEIATDLAMNPSSIDFGEGYLGKSAMKEITLSGLGLDPSTGTIQLTGSENIMLSTDKQNWSSSLEVGYQNGTIIQSFYARVSLTAVGKFNGTVTATIGDKSVETPVTINVIELGGGDPFNAVWSLTANDNAVITGNVVAPAMKLENMEKYGNAGDNYGVLIAPTGKTGAWPTAAIDDQNQYVQFAITAPEGRKLDINGISMKIKAQGGGSLQCHAYYSTDGFVTRKTIFSTNAALTSTWNEISNEDVVKVEEGEQLLIRVYPWSGTVDNGRWICIKDVVVSGQSKDAAGVNITGSISYKLDKGGLNQGDDAVFDPETLAAGFAGKSWTISSNSQLTVSGTVPFRKIKNDNTTIQATQTTIANNSGSTTNTSTAEDANTLTLTLYPEDGFKFVASKVSFKTAHYGTGHGNITAVAEAGDKKETIVDNKVAARGDNGEDITSISESIDGITATADYPLLLKFSFIDLPSGKSMGLSDLVIEGQLVGAAAQVTKYVLNTQVVPSAEAGSISRDPDMEQYKEGTQVTLKATKNFGYKFKEWQDANGNQVSTDAETTITMDAEKTMKAVFEQVNVYKVSTKVTNDAERDGLGSITLTPNDHNGQYEEGTQITATANESKIIKFLSWTDENENASASKERTLTVNSDMTLSANYEVQDFIAVFDASKSLGSDKGYAYSTTTGYPFAADEVWDNQRNAKASVVKMSDGSLCYTKSDGTPVVRNRQSVVISQINGLYQNGYRTTDIAWQYQFSTKGFTSAKFVGDMCAKNAATTQYKALISVDGGDFTELKSAWDVTANVVNPIEMDLPATAIDKETVVIRITGEGTETYNTSYAFDKKFDGLDYCDHSESGVGNVYILGDAIVEADETAPVVTSTIPANDATGISATGKITITFDERIESANSNGAVTLGEKTLQPEWSSRSVSFNYSQLDYGTPYTFTMPANYVQDKSGNKYAEAVIINFTTMQRPTVTKALYDQVVSNATELKAAIDAANSRADKSTRYRIFLKKGEYKLPTGATKHYKHTNSDKTETYWEGDLPDPITYVTAANISFIGEDRDATIITQDISNGDDMLFDGQWGKAHKYERIGESDVLQLTGANTYFQDVTIKSGIGDALGRNLAVHEKSNHTIYKNVCLWGYQDTWTSNADHGVFYFEGGVVRGRTDYLCGKGDAYFKDVELQQIYGGYPIVPSYKHNIGWVFKNCIINGTDGIAKYGEKVYSADEVSGSFTLGRPWGTGTPAAYLIDTQMNVQPKAIGWDEMSGTNYPYRFAEYNSVNANGAAIDLSQRKTKFGGSEQDNNNPRLTAEEAAELSDMSKMFGDWQPTLLTEQAPVPTNVMADNATLTWDDSNYALLWAVCKDGIIVDFTTTPTFTVKENGIYSVRAANEMGGLSAASKDVVVSTTTGIKTINEQDNNAAVVGIYTIDGKRIQQLQQGINIVRMSDGTTKKVMFK